MEPHTVLIVLLFLSFVGLLLAGIPVAYALGGLSFLFTAIAVISDQAFGTFIGLDFKVFSLVINRIYSLMENWVLVALPMFIFMGHMLDRSGIAENLMRSLQCLLGRVPGGLALSTALIGVMLAASTGIIGASVVLLGILSLPAMMRQGYSKELAVGTVCGAGTLGILIPPSIMLIIMADQLQLPVGSLFMGAVIPGLMLAGFYVVYILGYAFLHPEAAPQPEDGLEWSWEHLAQLFFAVIPAIMLIVLVLGSIFFGIATPTEASGLGSPGCHEPAFQPRGPARGPCPDHENTRLSLRHPGRRILLLAGPAHAWRRRTRGGSATFNRSAAYGGHHADAYSHFLPRLLPRLDRDHVNYSAPGLSSGQRYGSGLRPESAPRACPARVVLHTLRRHPADLVPHSSGRIRTLLR